MAKINCIVCPPGIDYEYMYQRPQQLLRACSNQNIKVVYISPNRYVASARSGKLPVTGSSFYLVREEKAIDYLQDFNPVVYFSSPASLPYVQSLKPSLVVFDSVDEPSEEFSAWKPDYYKALNSADLVIASSQQLFLAALSFNPSSYLIPNACDYELFSQNVSVIPAEIASLSGPIIGYCGAVASWCDMELILYMADCHPEYNLVMVGPLYNIHSLPQRPNLHWLGYKPYTLLPSYISNFDVGIIPFRISTMTKAVNPIKMWEYLATGIPVVASDLPEVRKLGDIVRVANDKCSFLGQVEKSLADDSISLRNRRKQIARENSWDARAEQLLAIIDHHLTKKGYSSLMEPRLEGLCSFRAPHISITKSIRLSAREVQHGQ